MPGRHIIRVRREPGDRRSPYVVAEELGVTHPPILRDTGRSIAGLFREVEGTGRVDRRRLRISVRTGTGARGVEVSRDREQVETEASAAGVKKVCRRLRGQEAAQLDEVDGRIEDLERQVDEARTARTEVVRAAWRSGNVVRVAEMVRRAREEEAGEGRSA